MPAKRFPLTVFPLSPLFLVVVAACHSAPPANVPVSGDQGTIARLAGEWSGSYQNPTNGRSGSVIFTFAEGQSRGDVVMVPTGGNGPLRPMPGQVAQSDTTRIPRVLTIEFVRAAGDSMSGTMTSYLDPECNCSATATFRGKIDGDRISGTFTTTQSGGRSSSGTWEVRRKS